MRVQKHLCDPCGAGTLPAIMRPRDEASTFGGTNEKENP